MGDGWVMDQGVLDERVIDRDEMMQFTTIHETEG
jgi:hypothetical protein